jgi:uncharacterized membrane protein
MVRQCDTLDLTLDHNIEIAVAMASVSASTPEANAASLVSAAMAIHGSSHALSFERIIAWARLRASRAVISAGTGFSITALI